jgi:hypothetical protein
MLQVNVSSEAKSITIEQVYQKKILNRLILLRASSAVFFAFLLQQNS